MVVLVVFKTVVLILMAMLVVFPSLSWIEPLSWAKTERNVVLMRSSLEVVAGGGESGLCYEDEKSEDGRKR